MNEFDIGDLVEYKQNKTYWGICLDKGHIDGENCYKRIKVLVWRENHWAVNSWVFTGWRRKVK